LRHAGLGLLRQQQLEQTSPSSLIAEATFLGDKLSQYIDYARSPAFTDVRHGDRMWRARNVTYTPRKLEAARFYASGKFVADRNVDDVPISLALPPCPSELRKYICGRSFFDADIASCHPTLALQIPGMYNIGCGELPLLKDWINNRSAWVDRISEVHGLPTDDLTFEGFRVKVCKQLINRLMFGGAYDAWIKEVLGNSQAEGPRCELVDGLSAELLKLRKAAFASPAWKPFVDVALAAKQREGKSSVAAMRSTWSLIVQTIEADILYVIRCSLEASGHRVIASIYDGVVASRGSGSPAASLRSAEARVLAERPASRSSSWRSRSSGSTRSAPS
jgi:hypothetical protein